MPELTLHFLGAPRVQLRGRSVEFDRHKSLALLAYLALTDQTHRRDGLAALLWPELDQPRARAGLRRVLFSLQAALPGGWWDVERETVSLRRGAESWCDVVQFGSLLAGRRAHGHPANETCRACLQPLNHAVGLYQGDLLSGFSLRDCPAFDDWHNAMTESLRDSLAGALELLVHWHGGQSQFEPALPYARQWLALDPLNELAHRQLMRLLSWSGQRSAALRQYADCLQLLDEELGVEPQAATRDLYLAIKDNQLPGPPGAGGGLATPELAAPTVRIAPVAGKGLPAPSARPHLVRGTMLGREPEWQQAAHLWNEARAGAGQVLLVSGEPGIGKSRFVHDLAGLALGTGGLVLKGECYTEGGSPYYPLAQIVAQGLEAPQAGPPLPNYLLADLLLLAPHLRPRFPHVAQPNPNPESEFERQRLIDSFVDWCRGLSASTPILMVVEDVHWADLGSLTLLQSLARRVPNRRLLLVLTFRDTEVEQTQARGLDRMLLDLLRERQAVALRLPRLRRDDTGALLGALLSTGTVSAEFIDSVFRETEGNPFFVEETCQSLIDDGKLYFAGGVWRRHDLREIVLPRTVRAAILGRVQRLPALVQSTLRLAAVIGRTFDFDLLKAVSPHSEDDLIAALEAGELLQLLSSERRSGSVLFMFAHALIPFALRGSLGHPRLRLMHAQVAAALEAVRPDDLDALAYHYAAGGQRAKAIAYLRRASERAIGVYAYDNAVRSLRQALDLLDAEPFNVARLELMERLADIEAWRGERVEAMHLYQAGLDLQPKLISGDEWAVIRVYRKMGDSLLRMQHPEALPFEAAVRAGMSRALEMTRNKPPHPETVRLLTALARDVYWENFMAGKRVEVAAADPSNADLYVDALVTALSTERRPRAGAEAYARAAIAMAELLDAPVELSAALAALDIDYASRQQHADCLELALRRLALSRDPRFDDPYERLDIVISAGSRLADVGQYARGLSYLLEAEMMAAQIGDVSRQINALTGQAECFSGLDRWDELLQIEEKRRVLEAENLGRITRMCFYCGLSANVLGLRGEREKARARRDEAFNNMLAHIGPVEIWPAIGHY